MSTYNHYPLKEAIYHWLESINCCSFAYPIKKGLDGEQLINYRLFYLSRSLSQISKIYYLAGLSIKHWVYNGNSNSRFDVKSVFQSIDLEFDVDSKKSNSDVIDGWIKEKINFKEAEKTKKNKETKAVKQAIKNYKDHIAKKIKSIMLECKRLNLLLSEEAGEKYVFHNF